MTPAVVRAGIQRSLDRMRLDRIDLLQFHWWGFQHPAYLDALAELAQLRDEGRIRHLGVTNFDADHLRLLLEHGIPIATNQVSFSLIDRRAAGPLSALCRASGVKLLAYGALCGGFLSEKWLGQPEPAAIADWSRSKYRRFIDAAGGWAAFQAVLGAAGEIARKHDVSIANVATRWVLDHDCVAGIIIGARLGESEHRADNLKVFDFALDSDDRARLDAAFAKTTPIPGDCGDEYRRPPFLTATGDLSHHLEALPPVYAAEPVPGAPDRRRVSSGTVWESLAGYSRALRIGDTIHVAGTTATDPAGRAVAPGDAAAQASYILDKIEAAIVALGGQMADVIRTRVYLRDIAHWEPVSRAHGRVFGAIRPVNTLLAVNRLVGDYLVEIEAEAVVSPAD
jgi:aryl-alcohol dehydrogenase-like predicted oxidoreductase/enamine deaminase RidA (YjgF/YER057c/UK114 family)